MAIVTMRQLLRAPAEAFGRIDDGEACLVTRNGKPVAALVPVAEADAERFLLAASPEFSQDRREAEHARAEGRTTSLEEVARRFGVSDLDRDDDGDDDAEELIEQAAAEAQAALPIASEVQASYYPRDDEAGSAAERVANLNRHLLLEFADALPSRGVAEAGAAAGEEPRGEPIGLAVEQVVGFNRDVVELGKDIQPSPYEAYVMGGIGAIERLRSLQEARQIPLPGRAKRVRRRLKARSH